MTCGHIQVFPEKKLSDFFQGFGEKTSSVKRLGVVSFTLD